jgi:hypothetical protein
VALFVSLQFQLQILQEYKWPPFHSHQSQRFSVLGFCSQEHA